MITLSGIRVEERGEQVRLICDMDWDGGDGPFSENTLWFSIKREYAAFFSTKVYDPFVLVPLYLAMYYGQDLKICGKVSKTLYKNVTNYVQRILRDFSDDMKPVQFTVDGFDVPERDADIVGAGISCGVDSLSTVYDRYVKETDPEYRISGLFLFNCGTHGGYDDPRSHTLFAARCKENQRAADDLGLPLYAVESNLHAFFFRNIGEQKVVFFAIWSCILSLQRRVRKYYISSGMGYRQSADYHAHYHDFDMDAFCGSYLLPLIQTESIRLIYDGAQYTRVEKTQNIADWDIARRHLNVCVGVKETAENCSTCSKCFRTLIVLDALGKLDAFTAVFDLEKYRKVKFRNLCKARLNYGESPFDTDNVDFARAHGIKVPSKLTAFAYIRIYKKVRDAVDYYIVQRLRGKH